MTLNKDDFIDGKKVNKMGYIKLFEYRFSIYKQNTESLRKAEKAKKAVLANIENVSEVNKQLEISGYDRSYNDILGIKRLAQIYEIVEGLINNNNLKYYNGIELDSIKKWLEKCDWCKEYMYLLDDFKNYDNTRKYVFDVLDLSMNTGCKDKHSFIRLPHELKCICCGATTKDYNLTDEELDYLTEGAKYQGIYADSINAIDMPYIQVLNITGNGTTDIKNKVMCAHNIDDETVNFGTFKAKNTNYLFPSETKKLLEGIEEEINRVKKIDSRFKDLMLETLNTVKYEVLILSSENIPTLYEEASEDEKYALAKAYYNLINEKNRVCNDYFINPVIASTYMCYTANPGVNQKVLEMIKR